MFPPSQTVLTKLFNYSNSAVSKVDDEYPAITAAYSGHLGYRNLSFDFRTPLTFLALNSFHEGRLCSYYGAKS